VCALNKNKLQWTRDECHRSNGAGTTEATVHSSDKTGRIMHVPHLNPSGSRKGTKGKGSKRVAQRGSFRCNDARESESREVERERTHSRDLRCRQRKTFAQSSQSAGGRWKAEGCPGYLEGGTPRRYTPIEGLNRATRMKETDKKKTKTQIRATL